MDVINALDKTTSKAGRSGRNYVKSTRKYYELKIFQQISLFTSYVLKVAIIGSIFALGLIFIAVAGAVALGDYLDNIALGYLSVGACFFLLALFIYWSRKTIDKFIIQKLSKTYFDS